MANMLLRVLAALCAFFVFGIQAAVPGKDAILAQIRKNGACVSIEFLRDLAVYLCDVS